MNKLELEKLLKSHPLCNFIAFGITLLHVYGIDASLEYLQSLGIEPNGFILMTEHERTGRLITKDLFTFQNSNIEYFNFTLCDIDSNKLQHIRERLFAIVKSFNNLESEKKLYIIAPYIYAFWFSLITKNLGIRRLIFIQIDDGSAAYVKNEFLNLFRLEYFSGKRGILNYLKKYFTVYV